MYERTESFGMVLFISFLGIVTAHSISFLLCKRENVASDLTVPS